MQDFKPKHFRLVKPLLFKLNHKKLYLASETPVGYVLRIDENNWCTFPKMIVEGNTKLFKPHIPSEQKAYNKLHGKTNRFLLIKRKTK